MPVPLDDFGEQRAAAPSRFTTLEEEDWSTAVTSLSSLVTAMSEMAATPPVCTRVCVVDDCPYRGLDGADLWAHVSANHPNHALVMEHVTHAVRVPYEGYWETNVKRFLLRCPFGVYVISLNLEWDPCSLMFSVVAHDSLWTVWEVICHEEERVSRTALWARAFDYHEVDSVFYQLVGDKGYWPTIFLRLLLD